MIGRLRGSKRAGARRFRPTAVVVGSMLGVLLGLSCRDPENKESCKDDAGCAAPQVCRFDPDGNYCGCEVGMNGAVCSEDTDCGGLGSSATCDLETCSCVAAETTGDTTSPTSSSPTDPGTTDPGTTDAGTTDAGTTDAATTDLATTGSSDAAHDYLCVVDVSSPDVEPSGARAEALQDYTGARDRYATTTTCAFGPNADPAHMDCQMVAGPKDFCAGDTGYVTLGGRGGWVCGAFEAPIENGDILTAQLCSLDHEGIVELSVCSEPDPASSSCIPCPLGLNGSCEVSGL